MDACIREKATREQDEMPTIPRFHVTQDAAWLFVHVHVPYVRVSEMEFYVDGTHFSFFCKPYLLKLQFPHEVVDDELAKAVYDPNKVCFVAYCISQAA